MYYQLLPRFHLQQRGGFSYGYLRKQRIKRQKSQTMHSIGYKNVHKTWTQLFLDSCARRFYIYGQAIESNCRQVISSVESPGSTFNFDKNGFLGRASPINRAVLNSISTSPHACFEYHWHYTRLAGHPGEMRVYSLMCDKAFWPTMADDVYATLKDCQKCAWQKSSDRRKRPHNYFQQRANCNLFRRAILDKSWKH